MPLITLGDNDELKLKIPSRGDIDWAEDFKLYFANPIVKHDHSGVNGMGKQLGANSLANNSIEERHVNFGLGALNEVSIPSDSTQIAADSYLRWTGNAWQPGSLDPAETSVYNPVSTGEGGAGGINTSELSEIYITELTNSDFPNGSWGGATSIDLTSKGDIDGVKIIVDVPNPDGKKLIVQSLTSCVIISNIDIEVTQTINKCIMILENDDSTSANPSCNLILTNTGTDPIIDACDVMADSIISGSHTNTKTLFRDSKIKIQDLDLQMTAAATSIIKSERSEVDISGEISNSVDLSSDSNPKLVLDNSKISFTALNQIGTGIFSTDANSELKQISSNYVKVWAGTRWNYLVSPSGQNKLITADSSGVPTEFSLTNGHVLKGGASGFTSEEFKLANLDDVSTSGLSTNEPLIWNGSQFVPGPALSGTNTINTTGGGISITSTPTSGQILAWNGSAFVPTNVQQEQRMLKETLKFERRFSHPSGATFSSTDMDGNSLTFVSSVPSGEYYTIDKVIKLSQDGASTFAVRASYDGIINNVVTTGGIRELVEWVGDTSLTLSYSGLNSDAWSVSRTTTEYTSDDPTSTGSTFPSDQQHKIYTRNEDSKWKIYPGQKISMVATADNYTPSNQEWVEYIIYITRHYIG